MNNERIEETGFEDLVVGNFNCAAVTAAKVVSACPVRTRMDKAISFYV